MRQRTGLILFITGVVLLLKPNFDLDQIVLTMNYLVAQYWPICFIIAGMILIIPRKKRRTRYR